MWIHFKWNLKRTCGLSLSPGPFARWNLGLLFGHATVSLADHEKPWHLQATSQQSHLLWREPYLLPTKQEKGGWKPSVKGTPHDSCGHESFPSAAPEGFQILRNCFPPQERLSDYQRPTHSFACLVFFFLTVYCQAHERLAQVMFSGMEFKPICVLGGGVAWRL